VTTSARSVVDPRFTAAVIGAFTLAGGAACLAVVAGTDVRLDHAGVALLVLGLAAVVAGALTYLGGHRLPRAGVHAVVAAGTLFLTAAVLLTPSTTTALVVGGFYSFVLIELVAFFSRREALAHLVPTVVAAAFALSHEGVSTGALVTLGVGGTTIALVVRALVRRASSAGRDSLTGLFNRRGFDDAVDAALATAERSGAPLSAALLDVDHFKAVNDRRGHAAGDALLQAVALETQRALPAGATLARYGGDEFAVLLPGHTGAQAQTVVERLRSATSSAELSAGIAELLPGHAAADLLRHADSALYAAKTAGRGRSRLHDDASVEMARELAVAIGAGQVRAWFQPIVSPTNGDVVGMESLARWVHPEKGLISPVEFVPVAETTGLICEMGLAVLADACRGAREVSDAWGRDLLLTVNVSGRELITEDYPLRVLEIVRETGWPADLLVVEVTESLLDGSSGRALAALDTLRAHGVSVAIDDFGTGYSAFSRLDTMPADYLKLDNVFMADITTSPRRAGMLQALLSLAHALGLQVIAEGVETQEQADLLSGMGCTLAQGWLFGRPVPPAELAASRPVHVDLAHQFDAEWFGALKNR
jgi:diguanylate cyclase (GGDEF)-like protein